tara:strand:+ start:93 stop:365 length:273 start_codon:yes stop_codon:yes gene_type:complete
MELLGILGTIAVGFSLGILSSYLYYTHRALKAMEHQFGFLQRQVQEGMITIPKAEYKQLREITGDEILREELAEQLEEEFANCRDDLTKA